MIYILDQFKSVIKMEEYCKRRAIPKNDCIIMCNRRLSKKMVNGLFHPGAVVINIKQTQYYIVLKEYEYKIVHHFGDVVVRSELLEEVYMTVSLLKRYKPDDECEYFLIGDINYDMEYSLGSIIGKMEKDMTVVCNDISNLRNFRW